MDSRRQENILGVFSIVNIPRVKLAFFICIFDSILKYTKTDYILQFQHHNLLFVVRHLIWN